MLESIHIRGFRSLREFRLRLRRVTVVTGKNEVGKSNLYRSLALLQKMAEGKFAESIAAEGAMQKLLWAGKRRKDEALRLSWEVKHADFEFSIDCGLAAASRDPSNPSLFMTDPEIKLETLHYSRSSRLMAKRKGPSIELRNPAGKMEVSPLPFHVPESMVSEIRDAGRSPTLVAVRETLLNWRFYHQFRTDPDSPMRRPQVGCRSPILAHDGSNLAAALQTIRESGKQDTLNEIIASALPGLEWHSVDEMGGFQLQIAKPDIDRTFDAAELSDGTLRFFCLSAALCTEKLPPFLVLNEPETSLHPELIPALAELIAQVPETTQLLIVTHSSELTHHIVERCEAKVIELVNYKDETRSAEEASSKRVWTFE
ncbi:AAA family ATPase [Luteolibacter pohnpeiensis]|uniref:AAA family ATPase n=1 Tax=Luteolibacter pohnpeiensis TaxID=454153 RepID=A0A934S6Y2_9BACT|nr:AAA family ATPase [Luteolibacter pohnpeiensis]MBK1881926.1 AAA family ATPase [Luteolibacter pohnpeiensis]